MKKVLVLLSTYNGEEFIQQQLDSLYAQTYKVDILVRDDGSKDSTKDILERNKNRINYYLGENVGCCHSFLDLVKHAPNDYDFYMFCDQDDYWLENKVEKAVEMVKKENHSDDGILYFSALNIADQSLNLVTKNLQTFDNDINKLTLPKSLIKSYGFGCTMLFNRVLKKKYAMLQFPFMDSHDWYMQKIALMFGKIVYDRESYILYRQHGSNVVGINPKNTFQKKVAYAKKAKKVRSRVANILLDTYSNEIDKEKKHILSVVAKSNKFRNRLVIAFSQKYKTFSFKINLGVFIYAILGII